jgi:hypothetical protein
MDLTLTTLGKTLHSKYRVRLGTGLTSRIITYFGAFAILFNNLMQENAKLTSQGANGHCGTAFCIRANKGTNNRIIL